MNYHSAALSSLIVGEKGGNLRLEVEKELAS